jgi:hypothetical protein
MSSLTQSVARHLTTIGVSGLLALAPVVGVTNVAQPAYAMTEAQAMERLNSIPVFTITDDKGAPLLAAIPQQPNQPQEAKQLLIFFLSPEDAQATLKQIQTNNPSLGNKARVSVLPFSQAYKVIKDNKDKTLAFRFEASRSSMESARAIIKAQGKTDKDVPPLPVFFATSGTGDKQGLLTIESEGQQTVPFFFDQKDLQSLLDRARQQQPNLAKDTKIQVTSLFVVLDNMITKDNKPNPDAQRFQFVPSRTAFEYVLKLSGSNPPANRPATPAPTNRPATPAPR